MGAPVLPVIYAHSHWANLTLIEFCLALDPAKRRLLAPGSYGTVETTIRHVVEAEEGYTSALAGRERPPRAAAGDPVDLAGLLGRARATGAALRTMLDADADRTITSRSVPATAGTILAQLVHHGNEHRGQVASILGGNGVEPPDLSVWRFASEGGVKLI